MFACLHLLLAPSLHQRVIKKEKKKWHLMSVTLLRGKFPHFLWRDTH